MNEEPTTPQPTRRTALAAIVGLGGALGAAVAGLVGGFLSNSFGRRREREWLPVGPAEDLDVETFQRVVLSEDHRNGWVRDRENLVVYIKDYYPDGDPVAFSARCSHLGCGVTWDAEAGAFLCPCHGGKYGEDGEVLAGPPPRPLTRLEVKVGDDEVCYVRFPEGEATA